MTDRSTFFPSPGGLIVEDSTTPVVDRSAPPAKKDVDACELANAACEVAFVVAKGGDPGAPVAKLVQMAKAVEGGSEAEKQEKEKQSGHEAETQTDPQHLSSRSGFFQNHPTTIPWAGAGGEKAPIVDPSAPSAPSAKAGPE